MRSQARSWCLTLNNYDETEFESWKRIGERRLDEGVSYIVFGKEVGGAGTPHLQGYVRFNKRRRLGQVKALFGARAHCEVARGSPAQNQAYCEKEGNSFQFGELPVGRGARTDITAALEAVKGGATRRLLLEEFPLVYGKYPRLITDALCVYSGARSWATRVLVYWGETGLGKTKKAFEECDEPYVHSGGPWFDGYDGQADVIFDDFGGSEFKLTYLLKLLDRYPMRVPVKGGFVNWVPHTIYITSNYAPSNWFPTAKDEHVKALLRRIEKVVHFRKLNSLDISRVDEEKSFIQ